MDEKAGIKKQYLKTKPICKVTFHLPKENALEAETVTVVGEFNNWDEGATPMKHQKNGDFKVVLELERGREYSFRYCIDGGKWENDLCADKYEPNPFGGYNSVVVVG